MEDIDDERPLSRLVLQSLPHRNGVPPLEHSVEELRVLYPPSGSGAASEHSTALMPTIASHYADVQEHLNAAPIRPHELHSDYQSRELVSATSSCICVNLCCLCCLLSIALCALPEIAVLIMICSPFSFSPDGRYHCGRFLTAPPSYGYRERCAKDERACRERGAPSST